ncbi:MAG: DNA polymerase III subunit gamma/tau [Neisseria sp.]|nr:DNA polymerase III subunit gamma/tau [Neisseria sp.]
MAYQVLARKWRPKTFADLVGQEHVVKALRNALDKGRLHHAYLLTGTRGVGKTTIARILAKSLNCENADHGEPCGVCGSCQDIDAGRFVDLLEIDAASNTGIDNIREVLENAQYAPTVGKYKVYIIDEVHMLSKSAFNAMLKTLEEPPEHVKFILATTDPHKVPITVLSRCLQFVLRNMTHQQVAAHLQHVLTVEQIPFEESALQILGRAAAGSMRDALSLLDQAIAMGSGSVTETDVRQMIGAVDKRYLYDLLQGFATQNGEFLLAKAQEMAARAIGFDNALAELAMLLQRLALIQQVPNVLAADDPEYAVLTQLAGQFSAEQLQLYYQCVIHGKNDLALAPDEYAGFVMTLLRVLAFTPLAAKNQPKNAQIVGTDLTTPSVQTTYAHSETVDLVKKPAMPSAVEQTATATAFANASNQQTQTESINTNHALNATTSLNEMQTASEENVVHENTVMQEKSVAESVPTNAVNEDTPPWDDARENTANAVTENTVLPETQLVASAETHDVQASITNEVQTASVNPNERFVDANTVEANTSELPQVTAQKTAFDVLQDANDEAAADEYADDDLHETGGEANDETDLLDVHAAGDLLNPFAQTLVMDTPANSESAENHAESEDEEQDFSPMPALNAANWFAIIERLRPKMGAAQMLAIHCAWLDYRLDTQTLQLALAPSANTVRKNNLIQQLQKVVQEAYGLPNLTLELRAWQDNQGWETWEMYDTRLQQQGLARAKQSLLDDPVCQQVLQRFDANIIDESVRLLASESPVQTA